MNGTDRKRPECPPNEPSILIIDDDSNNLAILSSVLEECNYTIFVAEDGESGISRAQLTMPDLILLDVLMPGIDGFETCRRLKEIEAVREIPVIFMTALTEISHQVRGFELGAVDYIAKPLQREEVLARVGVHLRNRHLTMELQGANELLEKRVAERTETLARTNEQLQKEIAERRQAEEELELLNLELERRVAEEVEKNLRKDHILFHNARLAAMGELLNNIAHQWRQPLNNMGLIVQGALADYREGKLAGESFTQCVQKTMEILRYLSGTINVFQSVFVPAGDPREFDPVEMVEKAASLVRAGYEQEGISLRVVSRGTLRMTSYDTELSQVVLNILNNAKDALLQRRPAAPAIDITCLTQGERNLITISDNGGGIPEEIMAKIFDPYFTTKFKAQGTGIGLYMSKMIVERKLGGTLSVRNTPEGAEFTIDLPTCKAPPPQAAELEIP